MNSPAGVGKNQLQLFCTIRFYNVTNVAIFKSLKDLVILIQWPNFLNFYTFSFFVGRCKNPVIEPILVMTLLPPKLFDKET